MQSPTARTLNRLRRAGWTAQVVEKWIPQRKRRLDLFGVIDVVAVCSLANGPTAGVLGVQATTRDHLSHRLTKARAEPRLWEWLAAGCRFQVWAWHKIDGVWRPVVRSLTLGDLEPPRVKGGALAMFDTDCDS